MPSPLGSLVPPFVASFGRIIDRVVVDKNQAAAMKAQLASEHYALVEEELKARYRLYWLKHGEVFCNGIGALY